MKPLFPPDLKYVESVTLNFDGCLVKIERSNEHGKYSINIDSGCINFYGIFETEYGYVTYVDLPYRISQNGIHGETTSIYDDYDWFIYSKLSDGCKYFSNGDLFGIEDINTILKNIKYGVDFLEFVKRHTIDNKAWVDVKYWEKFLSGTYERDE